MTRNMLTRLWSRLSSERGDADPVLTIVSMFVSALIATVVLGVMVIIIQFGGNFVTDQVRSITLATAQKAWSQDSSNASEVKVRDTQQATFYEEPGYRPGVYVARGDDKANQCRKSVWTLDSGILTNTVSKFSQPKCDLVTNAAGVQSVDPNITPLSSVKSLTLAGLSTSTKIVATNAADRDLHYVAGQEIGLATGSAVPSTNARATWWRNYEWAFTQPERINLVGKLTLPVSGPRPSTLRGDTSITPVSQGIAGAPETPPTQTVYDPSIVTNLKVTRSSTIGTVMGGVREGINVQFGGVSCGPYSTRYDIVWATGTVGATKTRTASAETFDAPLPTDLDKVQNGAVGEVTVTASCPTSTKPSVATFPYTQPLPTPVLTATAGTPPNVHTLTWAPVTSLAAQYTTELSRNGGPYAVNATASPNPTTATTETITYPLGSTYGVDMANRVTAAVGPTVSSPSAPRTVLTPWPFILPPGLTPTSTGLLLTVTSDDAVCPAGTHPEYTQTRNLNEAGTEPPSVWSANPAVQYTLGEGDQAVITGQARCVYSPAQVSPGSAPVTVTFVQPITTKPAPPTVTTPNPANDSDPIPVTYPTTGCPVNTTPEYQIRYSVNDGAMSSWTAWSAATTQPVVGVQQGDKLILDVHARCVSPYTQGPPGTTTTTTWVRPIPAPAAAIAGHDAGGPSGIDDDRFTYTAVVCPNTTVPAYLRDWFVAGIGAGNDPTWVRTLNMDVATNWGFNYNYAVYARCESPYTVSGPSAGATTGWPTSIPTPNGTPTLSLSASSAQVNTTFGVSLGGVSCPTALQLVWTVAPNGGQVSGSFTTRHSTTGPRTYTASALCHSSYSGRDGPAKAARPATITITAAPVPGAPGGVSARWAQGRAGGAASDITFGAVADATKYEYGGHYNGAWGSTADTATVVASSGNYQLDSLCTNQLVTSAGARARAGNSTGWSGFTSVPASPLGPVNSCS
ncbi:RHS repeat domain-containing protein [Lacisediminihabitans sp. FW035]